VDVKAVTNEVLVLAERALAVDGWANDNDQ